MITYPSGTIIVGKVNQNNDFYEDSLDCIDINAVAITGTQTVSGSKTFVDTSIFNGDLQIADGQNIAIGTSSGTKIGTDVSQKIGLYGVPPVAQASGYTLSNIIPTRTLDANNISFDQLADIVGTLLQDMKNLGAVG